MTRKLCLVKIDISIRIKSDYITPDHQVFQTSETEQKPKIEP